MAAKQPKARTCACGCGERFTPSRPLQPTRDNFDCKVRFAEKVAARSREKREREERQRHREKLNATRKLSWFEKKTEKACNAYIRERDKNEPCISCGSFDAYEWHAGHFKPAGTNASLRYHPANIHKQCSACNTHKSANLSEYRPNLVRKIGAQMVEFLEGPQPAAHYTREDLLEIEKYYKQLLKEVGNAV